MPQVKVGPLALRYGNDVSTYSTISEKMPDPNLPGPSPAWVTFMGIPYEPADAVVQDKRTYLATAKVEVWAYRCADIIATQAVQVPIRLYKGDAKNKKEVKSHPILDLLDTINPTPQMEGSDFTFATFWTWLLRGENYIEVVRNKAGLPAELYWLSPDIIRAVPHPKKFLAGFKLQTGSGETFLNPEDVFWWRRFNPLDQYGGLTPIEALRQNINLDVSAMNVQQSIYKNGGLARGIIAPDNKDGIGFAPGTMKELEEEWKTKHGGSRNAFSVAFLSQAVKWLDLGLKENEAQWISTRANGRMEICSAFGVPLEIATSESHSYDNLRSARLALWHETVIPWLKWRDRQYNNTIVRAFDPDKTQRLFLEADISDIQALKPDYADEERVENEGIRTGKFYINELRKKKGLEAVKWGDGYWAPYTYADMAKGDGTPFPRTSQTVALPTEAGVPPSGSALTAEDLPALADEQRQATADAAAAQASAAGAAGQPDNGGGKARRKALPVLRTPEQRAAIGDRHARALGTIAEKFAREVRATWQKQADDVIAKLPEKRRKMGQPEDYVVSAHGDLVAVATNAFQNAGVEAYESVRDQLKGQLKEADAKGFRLKVSPSQAIGSLQFDMDNPALVELAKQLGTRVSGIDDTTLTDLREILGEGLRRGYSVAQIADGVPEEDFLGIKGMFDAWGARADTIARTETSWAFNQASLQAYKDSTVVEMKEWLLGIGDAEGHCDALDGEQVGVDEQFSDGSDAPPDPHPNCTCTLLPVLMDLTADNGGDSSGDGGDEEKALPVVVDSPTLVQRANALLRRFGG